MTVKERFQINSDTGSNWVEVCDRKQPHASNNIGTPVARVIDFRMAEMLASELNLRGWTVEGQPAKSPGLAEAEVIINGKVLSAAESCTLRMALNSFIVEMNERTALSGDASYDAVRAIYKSNANRALRIMHGQE